MYQELIKELENNAPDLDTTKYNAALLSTNIELLQQLLDDIITKRAEEDIAFDRYLNIDVKQVCLSYAIAEGSDKYRQIVTEEFDNALAINNEFDIPAYKRRLLSALRDPDSFIIDTGVHGSTIVNVIGNLDKTAGTLDDWYSAIKAARNREKDELYPSVFAGCVPNTALSAHFWAEKYYGTAREDKKVTRTYKRKYRGREKGDVIDLSEKYAEKYWDTMTLRLQRCTSLAPFWEIIDQGVDSIAALTGTDKKYAHPINVKTNFVKNICDRLKNLYSGIYNEAYRNLNTLVKKQMDKIINNLTKLEKLKEATDAAIKVLEENGDITEKQKKEILEALNEKLKSRFGYDLSGMKDAAKASQLLTVFLGGRSDLINLNEKITVGVGQRVRLKSVYNAAQEILRGE